MNTCAEGNRNAASGFLAIVFASIIARVQMKRSISNRCVLPVGIESEWQETVWCNSEE